jgi:hypothetical protein
MVLLGIGVVVLLIGTVAYVAWLVYQSVGTGARIKRLEKEAMRRARREDREDGYRRPVKRMPKPTELLPPHSSDASERPRSSAESAGGEGIELRKFPPSS